MVTPLSDPYLRRTAWSGLAISGLSAPSISGEVFVYGGPLGDYPVPITGMMPINPEPQEITFPEDKDDALLPIENDIKEDCIFLSDDTAYQDDMTIQLKNSAELLEMQNRDEKAHQEQQRLYKTKMTEQWNADPDISLHDKIPIFAKLEKFTGLTDLDDTQMHLLRVILSRIEPRDIRKNKRAVDLVKKWLTPEEWKELLETSKVTIHSKKHKNRYYEVSAVPSARVNVFESKRFNKLPVNTAKVCGVDAVYGMADGDKFLNKVIALKEDEDGYMERSNVSRY